MLNSVRVAVIAALLAGCGGGRGGHKSSSSSNASTSNSAARRASVEKDGGTRRPAEPDSGVLSLKMASRTVKVRLIQEFLADVPLVTTIAFSDDGLHIAYGTTTGVFVLNSRSLKQVGSWSAKLTWWPHIVISKKGMVVIGRNHQFGGEPALYSWNPSRNVMVSIGLPLSVNSSPGPVWSMCYLPGLDRAVLVDGSKYVHIFRPENVTLGIKTSAVILNHTFSSVACAITKDVVVAAGSHPSVFVMRHSNAGWTTELRKVNLVDGWISAMALSPNAELAALGNINGRITVVDLVRNGVERELCPPLQPDDVMVGSAVGSMDIRNQGDIMAVSSTLRGIELYDLVSSQKLLHLGTKAWGKARVVRFNNNGTKLAAGFLDGKVRIWSLE